MSSIAPCTNNQGICHPCAEAKSRIAQIPTTVLEAALKKVETNHAGVLPPTHVITEESAITLKILSVLDKADKT